MHAQEALGRARCNQQPSTCFPDRGKLGLWMIFRATRSKIEVSAFLLLHH